MFTRARLLQLGYIVTLAATAILFALPTESVAQFRRSHAAAAPPPPAMRPISPATVSQLGSQFTNAGNGQYGQAMGNTGQRWRRRACSATLASSAPSAKSSRTKAAASA